MKFIYFILHISYILKEQIYRNSLFSLIISIPHCSFLCFPISFLFIFMDLIFMLFSSLFYLVLNNFNDFYSLCFPIQSSLLPISLYFPGFFLNNCLVSYFFNFLPNEYIVFIQHQLGSTFSIPCKLGCLDSIKFSLFFSEC